MSSLSPAKKHHQRVKYHVEKAGYDQAEVGSLLHLLYKEVSGLYQLRLSRPGLHCVE